ncbi:hypothetical protein [Streptomyces bluensis]|uniref:hypothetical protein n=1 Tax=Streptomyces bluensis TaxID=33897 RepID=UPI0033265F6B
MRRTTARSDSRHPTPAATRCPEPRTWRHHASSPHPHITRVLALAAGLAAAGSLALSAPASASGDVSATLRVTVTSGDSVYTQINGDYTCYRDFTVGTAKDIPVSVAEGQWIQVFSSNGCYDSLTIGGTYVERDGQVIELSL